MHIVGGVGDCKIALSYLLFSSDVQKAALEILKRKFWRKKDDVQNTSKT